MDKILKFLPLLFGLAAISCTDPEFTPESGPQSGRRMNVTLTAGETRTAMVPSAESGKYTSKWTTGDRLGVFVRAEGADVDCNVPTEALEADATTASFDVSVTQPSSDATYEFYTYYPYSSLESQNYKAVKVEIPAEQNPANDSFDPKADILSGYPVERDVDAGQTELSGLSLQFIRKTSVVKLQVSRCEDFDGIDGDTYVTEVKVTFDKNVVGTASWDITDSTALTLDESSASGTVVVKYDEDTHKVTDPIWLSIAPVSGVTSIGFAFKVGDNAYLHATATLSKPVTFKAGGVKKFEVPISGDNWDLKSLGVKYEKVTSEPADWCGEYLIVGENEGTLYACDQQSTGNWGSCTEVTAVADGSITATETVNGYAFTVVPGTADGTYAFVFRDGDYVSSGAVKKFNEEEKASAGKTDFKLTSDADSVKVESNAEEGRVLRYNYNNGKGGLRFYDSKTAKGVSLYRKVDDYTVIVPVIAEPQGIPASTSKDGVTDAQFTCAVTNLGKNSVSVKSFDGTVVTAASVSYTDGTATVTYTVAANTDADRHGSIVLKAGATENTIDVYQETGIVLPVIDDVDDQNVNYEASDVHTFDVTIANVGENTVSCTFDGTVVTAASVENKSGNVWTVTYTVTENEGIESRDGKITVKCSTVSKDVNIVQNYNESAVKTYKRVASLSDIEDDEYVIVASTSTITAYLPNDFNTSSAPSAVTTGFICTDSEFKTLTSNAGWTFSGTTSAMTIRSAADAANYLYNINNTNGTRVGTTSDTWEIKTHSSAGSLTDVFEFKDASNDRYTGIYNNADWRSYTSATASNYTAAAGSSQIKLYGLDYGKASNDLSATNQIILANQSLNLSSALAGGNGNVVSYSVSPGGPAIVDGIFSVNNDLASVKSYTVIASQPASETVRAKSVAFSVTVNKVDVVDITLNETSKTVYVGDDPFTLTATLTPSDATDKGVVWSSDNASVASVNDGTITVKSAGEAVISVTSSDNDDIKATLTLTVLNVPVASVSLDTNEKSIDVGDSFSLIPTISPDNATITTVNWYSSDETIATVNEGLVKGISAGVVTITAKSADDETKFATCEVTVSNVSVNGISLDCTDKTIGVGGSFTLTPTLSPSNATNKNVSWTSSDESVAEVSSAGVVTGINAGSATITAKTEDGEMTASCLVTVVLESSKFSKTYDYGLDGWSLTEYTDKSSYYLVPSSDTPSVASISGLFESKTISSDVKITLTVATFGSGTNPSSNTFSIYNSTDCTNPIAATQSGTLPTSSAYTDAVYTVSKSDAIAGFSSDLAVKITKPGRQIRLKSIKVEFEYFAKQ